MDLEVTMNENRKYGSKMLVLIVAFVALSASVACGTVADAADKAIYEATPTCEQKWSNAVVLSDYKEFFYIRDGNQTERLSLAGITNLFDQPSSPVACYIVREKIGSGYNLVDCYPTDSYGVFVGEEGLLLSK